MTVRFSIFTLVPEMFTAPFAESIIRRAIDAEFVIEFVIRTVPDLAGGSRSVPMRDIKNLRQYHR